MYVPEFRWDKGGTTETEEFIFYENGMKNHQLGAGYFTPQNSNQQLRD
jgi:hypothetical protein